MTFFKKKIKNIDIEEPEEDYQKCYIGAHASTAKGILKGLQYIYDIGGNVTQIFLGSTTTSSLNYKTIIEDSELNIINKWLKVNNHKLFVHAPYTLNLSRYSPLSPIMKKQFNILQHEFEIIQKMGGLGFIVHMGYKLDLTINEAVYNMVENIKHILKISQKTAPDVKIILETAAGQGTQIAFSLEDFTKVWNSFDSKEKKRLGVCIDTAHVFSSGYNIRTVVGIKMFLIKISQMIGKENISLFHINDSKEDLNSRLDKHFGIGQGFIYNPKYGGDLKALKVIWQFAKLLEIPMILETHSAGYYTAPKDKGKYYQEIQLFRYWDKGIDFETKFKLKSSLNLKKILKKSKSSILPNQTFKNNELLITVFKKVVLLYKLKKDRIRIRVYERAIDVIQKHPQNITKGDDLKKYDGIGPSTIKKIDEILKTGTLTLFDEEKLNDENERKKQELIIEYMKIHGIGLEKAKELAERKMKDKDFDIKKYIEKSKPKPRTRKKSKSKSKSKPKPKPEPKPSSRKKVSSQKSIKLNKQQILGIKYKTALKRMIPRYEMEDITNLIKRLLRKSGISKFKNVKVVLAGSYQRGAKQSKDIDIILVTDEYDSREDLVKGKLLTDIIEYLIKQKFIKEVITLGNYNFMGLVSQDKKETKNVRHLDILMITKKHFMFGYLYFTSGKEFNKKIRFRAKQKGYRLNEWGLYDVKTNIPVKIRTEEQLFDFLGMRYVPVEDR